MADENTENTLPSVIKPGDQASEFRYIVKPTAYTGLGMVVLGVLALVIPPIAPMSAVAISTGLTLLGGSGGIYMGQRTLLKSIEVSKRTVEPAE